MPSSFDELDHPSYLIAEEVITRALPSLCCSWHLSTLAQFPGGLQLAIDWASCPYGQSSFTRKPSAVIGTSLGAIGTAVAQRHLRSVHSSFSDQMHANGYLVARCRPLRRLIGIKSWIVGKDNPS